MMLRYSKTTRFFICGTLLLLFTLAAVGPVSRVLFRGGDVVAVRSEQRFGCSPLQSRLNYRKIFVFSDPHYYAPELGTTGSAFEEYLKRDRKLLAESDAILRKTIEVIKTGDAGIVLISGDLTKDGELVSHCKMAEYLRVLEEDGRKVFVIDGNHDINNPKACSYQKDKAIPVAGIMPDKFKEVYGEFGYREAIARDPKSLSYVVEPIKGIRIVVMDSAYYDTDPDNKISSGTVISSDTEISTTAGGFTEARLNWGLRQVSIAKAQGNIVLGMMHHGLVEHFSGQTAFFGEYLVNNPDTVATKLAQAGMDAVFTGHFHAQDIAAKQIGVKCLYDIETGSLVTYPNPYRIIEITSAGKLKISSARIRSIDYDLPAGDFQSYARNFLSEGLNGIAPRILTSILVGQGIPPQAASEQADAAMTLQPVPGITVRDLVVNAIIIHYQGDEVVDEKLFPVLQKMSGSQNPLLKTIANVILSFETDFPPPDNNVILKI